MVHRAPKLIVSSSQNTPQGLLMTPWAVWRLGGLVLVSSDFFAHSGSRSRDLSLLIVSEVHIWSRCTIYRVQTGGALCGRFSIAKLTEKYLVDKQRTVSRGEPALAGAPFIVGKFVVGFCGTSRGFSI